MLRHPCPRENNTVDLSWFRRPQPVADHLPLPHMWSPVTISSPPRIVVDAARENALIGHNIAQRGGLNAGFPRRG
jgi:hypothetical protein